MELSFIDHGPNLPTCSTSREGRLCWVTALSKHTVAIMKVHQVAGTLLATAVACFQRLTIAMSNIRTITSQGNLILTPLYPLLFPMTISAIATMEIKEAGCFFKANLHLCNMLQWNAAEVLKQFLAHVLFRPFDAEGLNLMRNGICEDIRKNPTKLAKICQDRTHKFKLLAVQSTMPWKGTAKKSERITGIPHTTGIPTICCCAKPKFTRKLKQTKPKFDALSGRIQPKKCVCSTEYRIQMMFSVYWTNNKLSPAGSQRRSFHRGGWSRPHCRVSLKLPGKMVKATKSQSCAPWQMNHVAQGKSACAPFLDMLIRQPSD